MEIRKIAGALGAELVGADLSKEFPEKEIRNAFLEHQVIFFHDQPLTPAQFVAFARRMGKPVEYPFVKGLDGFPEVIEVKKLEHERYNFGGIWHSDTTYLEEPPMGSMLLARELPPYGGDTLFANQYLAYETLSEGMRSVLDGLIAVNSSANADVSRTREDRIKEQARTTEELASEHPVVRTHPETGRKALFVNRSYTQHFSGMTAEESAPLLEFLWQHATRPEFTCRFRWETGSVAVWDNRCTMHIAVNDVWKFPRLMHRVQMCGDRPV